MAISPNLVLPMAYDTSRERQPLTAQPPVTSQAGSTSQSDRTRAPEPAEEARRTTRRTTIDSSTGALVYQVIDAPTGQKIDQTPEESILRIRAYTRQADLAKQADASSETPKASKG